MGASLAEDAHCRDLRAHGCPLSRSLLDPETGPPLALEFLMAPIAYFSRKDLPPHCYVLTIPESGRETYSTNSTWEGPQFGEEDMPQVKPLPLVCTAT